MAQLATIFRRISQQIEMDGQIGIRKIVSLHNHNTEIATRERTLKCPVNKKAKTQTIPHVSMVLKGNLEVACL